MLVVRTNMDGLGLRFRRQLFETICAHQLDRICPYIMGRIQVAFRKSKWGQAVSIRRLNLKQLRIDEFWFNDQKARSDPAFGPKAYFEP